MAEPVLKIYWLSNMFCFSARQWQTGLPLTANVICFELTGIELIWRGRNG